MTARNLTPRQTDERNLELLRLSDAGASNREIAKRLDYANADSVRRVIYQLNRDYMESNR